MTEPRLAAYAAARRWAAEHGHPQPDDRMLDAAFAALPGWGTYRTAWESGYGAGRADEAAGVPTERTGWAALSTPPDTEETTT